MQKNSYINNYILWAFQYGQSVNSPKKFLKQVLLPFILVHFHKECLHTLLFIYSGYISACLPCSVFLYSHFSAVFEISTCFCNSSSFHSFHSFIEKWGCWNYAHTHPGKSQQASYQWASPTNLLGNEDRGLNLCALLCRPIPKDIQLFKLYWVLFLKFHSTLYKFSSIFPSFLSVFKNFVIKQIFWGYIQETDACWMVGQGF